VAIVCDQPATTDEVGHEPWREVPGQDGDFVIAAFFDGTLPEQVAAGSARLLAARAKGCHLVVDRVELRILLARNAIKTLRVRMPAGD
jgi:hypothetical protein